MKKVIILITIIILKSVVQTNAQTKTLDSLRHVISITKHDTTRIKLYLDIGNVYENINLDSAILYYQKALSIIQTNSNNKQFLLLKVTTFNYIGICYFSQGSSDKALNVLLKALKISEKLGDKKGMSKCYFNIAVIHASQGTYDKANEYYKKALKIDEESGDKIGISYCYNNIGLIHFEKGNYEKAIENYYEALKILEKSGNIIGMPNCYNNIGNVLFYQGNYIKSLEYFYKALKIFEDSDNKSGMSSSYINIGNVHNKMVDYEKAMAFYLKSLKINEDLGDKSGISNCYTNIGIVHDYQGSYNNAIKYYLKSLKIKEELSEFDGIAALKINIGIVYNDMLDFNRAKKFCNEGLSLSNKINHLMWQRNACNCLADAYIGISDFKQAIEYKNKYIQLNDSMFSEEKTKSLAEMGAKYEAEKKELIIQKLEKEKLLQNETIARKEAESKKQRILIFSFLVGFIIILIFSVFLFRLFMQKKKANVIIARKNQSLEIAFAEINTQKEEITAQRDEIEAHRDTLSNQNQILFEQKKEITDSINYAKRIQQAMLPELSPKSQAQSHKFLNLEFETFIIFRPKDIVSGDFYWFSQVNDYQIYAVADCTGHGVPGAFMSMLGISFLNEIVRKKEVTQASHVLDQLRVSIIDALRQTGESGTQKDGMDMSLVVISQLSKSSELLESSELYHAQWSGANNPLWVVRAVTQSSGLSVELAVLEEHTSRRLVLQEMKPDKQPVAIYENMKPFTNHEIQLYKGDTIYLMSDGYQDQFGGLEGKKFLSKNLKELIIANCLLTMEEQKEILNTTFENWKGDNEQIDDVTLLGIKILKCNQI